LLDPFTGAIISFSVSTGSIAAELRQIPNLPIHFSGQPNKTMDENEVLAWTWRTFIENGSNPEVILFLPMTKVVFFFLY